MNRDDDWLVRHQTPLSPPNYPHYPIDRVVKLVEDPEDNLGLCMGRILGAEWGQEMDDTEPHWYYWVKWSVVPDGKILNSGPGKHMHLWKHTRLDIK